MNGESCAPLLRGVTVAADLGVGEAERRHVRSADAAEEGGDEDEVRREGGEVRLRGEGRGGLQLRWG